MNNAGFLSIESVRENQLANLSKVKKYSDYKWVVMDGEINIDIMLGDVIK